MDDTPRGKVTDDPKFIRLEIRLTEDTKAMLDYCAEANGYSMAEGIRRGIAMLYQQTIGDETKE